MASIQWIIGAVILFLGCELSFIFSAAMAGYLATRLTFLLPSTLPPSADLAFVIALAIIAGWVTTINKDMGFYITGALAGGYLASEFFAPTTASIPILPFLLGAIVVAAFIGLLKDWGLIIASCITGIYILYGVLPLVGMTKTLASTGIFVVGGLVQVVLFQAQKHS